MHVETVEAVESAAFVGVDWGSEQHAVCVLGVDGRKLKAFNVAHSKEGFGTLIQRLAVIAPAGNLPVAIERPDGRCAAGGWSPSCACLPERHQGVAGV